MNKKEKKVKEKKENKSFDYLRQRFSVKEQTLFAKRLAFLVKAGVPILDSLNMLKKQTRSKAKGRMLDRVINDVSNGQFLATSLAKFQNSFGNFAINIIRVGELSGILEQNLAYLAEELRKKQVLRKKVLGAMIYPIFITIATLGLTGVLTVYIFPKVLPIFKSLNVHLPFTTRTLIFLSAILRSYGIFLILGIILLVVLAVVAHRMNSRFRRFFDASILKLPLSGEIARNYNLTNIARTLGLLLKSSVRVIEAVQITADTTTNVIYKTELQEVAERVTRGEKISQQLERRPTLFPDIFVQMVAIGEKTGNLSESLLYLAEMYENEVDDSTKNLSSSIEPILMVIMGLVVGFIAVSIITPIYEITQNLHP